MSQSLAKIYTHLILSTKHRQPLLCDSFRERFHTFIQGVCREMDLSAIEVNSEPDHIHFLFCLSRTLSLADTVKELKRSTSFWVKKIDLACHDFQWQAGYGAFSISESRVEDVRHYIRNQREHHRKETFQEEFRRWLTKYRLEYDEKYVWD